MELINLPSFEERPRAVPRRFVGTLESDWWTIQQVASRVCGTRQRPASAISP